MTVTSGDILTKTSWICRNYYENGNKKFDSTNIGIAVSGLVTAASGIANLLVVLVPHLTGTGVSSSI